MTDPCMLYMIYMVTWIPSIYPSHVGIYSSTMDPSWDIPPGLDLATSSAVRSAATAASEHLEDGDRDRFSC